MVVTGACEPISAATAAFCVIDVTFEVEWLWIALDAAITVGGAVCPPQRHARPPEAELPAAAPAGHRVGLRRRAADHRLLRAALRQDLRQVVRHRVVDQLL